MSGRRTKKLRKEYRSIPAEHRRREFVRGTAGNWQDAGFRQFKRGTAMVLK